MRIKLDENLPLELQSGLGGLGHDVHSVFDENLAGEPDDKIWHACTGEERFLITQDLDFSDARKYPPLVDTCRNQLARVACQRNRRRSRNRGLVNRSAAKIGRCGDQLIPGAILTVHTLRSVAKKLFRAGL